MSFNYKDYWNSISSTNNVFSLGNLIRDNRGKKIFYKETNINKINDSNCVEITLFDKNRQIILDFDHFEKQVIVNSDVTFFLKQYNLYSESSMNGGFHIFVKFNQDVVFKNSINITSEIICEFKHKSIIYPTDDYTIINSPQDIESISLEFFNNFFNDLCLVLTQCEHKFTINDYITSGCASTSSEEKNDFLCPTPRSHDPIKDADKKKYFKRTCDKLIPELSEYPNLSDIPFNSKRVYIEKLIESNCNDITYIIEMENRSLIKNILCKVKLNVRIDLNK